MTHHKTNRWHSCCRCSSRDCSPRHQNIRLFAEKRWLAANWWRVWETSWWGMIAALLMMSLALIACEGSTVWHWSRVEMLWAHLSIGALVSDNFGLLDKFLNQTLRVRSELRMKTGISGIRCIYMLYWAVVISAEQWWAPVSCQSSGIRCRGRWTAALAQPQPT